MATTYKKGEHIVYGKTGVCLIDDIKPLSFYNGQKETLYYILKPIYNSNAVVYVPYDNQDLVSKMRYVMSEEEIENMLEGLKGKTLDWIEHKNSRNDCFQQVITDGNQEELIMLVDCLYLQKQEREADGKKLTTADDAFLKAAEKLIEEEFSFSLKIDPNQVANYIEERLQAEV